MKIRKIQLAIMTAALVMAVQARATLYDIAFTDSTSANTLTATLDVNGSNLAILGTATVTGIGAGTYSLVPGGPDGALSPMGAFNYDNVVIYGNDPFIDGTGLLFSDGTTEIALFSVSSGNNGYVLWGYTVSGGFAPEVVGGAAISLVPVPEPTTMIAGALLLLPFGASTLRLLRKNRTA